MDKTLLDYFSDLPDPRVERTKLHKLEDILAITICAVICGAEGWNEIELFGQCKQQWLESFLELPNGIPSHDTFARVVSSIKPDDFEQRFQRWIQALAKNTGEKIIAIDGKTLRRSFDTANRKAAIHMVSAWACENKMVFGQVVTDGKSNEITAIPKLLEMLVLDGSVVTIDAMGCQKKIAEKIIDGNGDYVFSLKGNHGTLHEEVKLFMDDAIANSRHCNDGMSMVRCGDNNSINIFLLFEHFAEIDVLFSPGVFSKNFTGIFMVNITKRNYIILIGKFFKITLARTSYTYAGDIQFFAWGGITFTSKNVTWHNCETCES